MAKKSRCPFPEKQAHVTRRRAQSHLFQLLNKKRDNRSNRLHTYHCVCGKYHVGHDKTPVLN